MNEQPSAAQGFEVITRVLVVDDDQAIRSLLQMALESEGYEVATAADGAVAVEFLTHTKDAWIVLLDVAMPNVDGLGVCAWLYAAGSTVSRHRVALMTAGKLGLKECPPPARTLLPKPFRLNSLHTLVAALAHNQAGWANGLEQPE